MLMIKKLQLSEKKCVRKIKSIKIKLIKNIIIRLES